MAKRKMASTNTLNMEKIVDFCGATYAIDILGGRWKLVILYKLEKRTLRFGELKELIPGITDRMLTLHLRELEKSGLLVRTAFAEVPPRVEYTLTESARRLAPIWKELEEWGGRHRGEMDKMV